MRDLGFENRCVFLVFAQIFKFLNVLRRFVLLAEAAARIRNFKSIITRRNSLLVVTQIHERSVFAQICKK